MSKIQSSLGLILFALLLFNCNKDENEKPVISIVSPENGHSVYKGDSIEIIVNANDPDGLIETVDFIIDDNHVYQSKIAPYKYVWHTGKVKGGLHHVSVIATDNNDVSEFDEINLEVKTILPEIKTSPVSFVGTTLLISGGEVISMGIPAIYSQGICWNTSGTPTLGDNYMRSEAGMGVFVMNASGLELGTEYYIRAFVENVDTVIYGMEYSESTASSYFSETGTFVNSRDSSQYNWVKIGDQTWMAENLKYLASGVNAYVYNHRDITYDFFHTYSRPIKDIPAAKSTENYKTYGCLYLAHTNICPTGWHIPSNNEWQEVINYLGGADVAGGILKESGNVHWNEPNIGANNLSQFRALPAGGVHTKYGDSYSGINTNCVFYTSDIGTVSLTYDSEKIIFRKKDSYYNGWNYYSIRCIKD